MVDHPKDLLPTGLDLLLAEHEIHQALFRYARGNNRHDWEAVRASFHPDAFDDHLGGKGSPDQIVEHLKQRHAQLGDSGIIYGALLYANVMVDFVDATHAVVESYTLGFQRFHEAGQLKDVTLHCRFIDRFERRGGGPWLIAHRVVLYGARRYDAVDERAVAEEERTRASQRVSQFGPSDELYATPGARWYSTGSDA